MNEVKDLLDAQLHPTATPPHNTSIAWIDAFQREMNDYSIRKCIELERIEKLIRNLRDANLAYDETVDDE